MNKDTIYRENAICIIDGIDTWQAGWRDNAVKSMKALPSAHPEPQWIPCSERLSEIGEKVLTTTIWDDITIAWRIGTNKWFIHEGGINATTEELVAWMPLPEPYAGE